MKSSYLRAVIVLLCAVLLNACGGNNGSLALSGTITYAPAGVTVPSFVLINNGNGEKVTIDSGVTTFIFTKLLATDEQFDVEVVAPGPAGADCKPSANTGSASVYTVYYVTIACTANPYVLGGTVKGLSGAGLVLANGSDTTAVLPAATAGADVKFTFPTKVGNSAAYGVSVLTQPAGQTCSVSSTLNPGTMPDADQLGLSVSCVNN
jgi:hypothetical protein